MPTDVKRAAIYLRISQDPYGDGLAVERQRDECKRIVKERGWTLVDTYSDTVSASKRSVKRPEYERLMADFEAERFTVLVCWDLDRLTRQPRQIEDLIDLAEDRGLIVVTANGEADLSNHNGRMFARVKASIARNETDQKSARQKFKNLQRSAAGEPVPGRRRYGYLSDNRTLEPTEAARVAYLFESVSKGASSGLWQPRWVRAGALGACVTPCSMPPTEAL